MAPQDRPVAPHHLLGVGAPLDFERDITFADAIKVARVMQPAPGVAADEKSAVVSTMISAPGPVGGFSRWITTASWLATRPNGSGSIGSGWSVGCSSANIAALGGATPSAAQLKEAWRRSGKPLRALFNTAGQSYRQGGFKDRLPSLSDDEALAALAADGKLIKRPLLDTGEVVLVGFREEEWRAALL